MNILPKILFGLFLFQTVWLGCIAQSNKATIVFPGDFHGIFNSYKDFKYTPLEIGKNSKANNSTTKVIIIEKPLHMYSSFMLRDLGVRHFQSLLLLPGDSIILGYNGNSIKYAKGYNNYIDNLISIQAIYPQKTPVLIQNKINLFSVIKSIDKIYLDNEVRIQNLKIDAAHSQALSDFNFIVKCASLTNDSFQNLPALKDIELNKVLDSIYTMIIKNYVKFENINSPFVNRIYYTIINYQLQKQGISPNKKWDHLIKISHLPFFTNFLILSLNNANDKDVQERDIIYNKIKAATFADYKIKKLYTKLKEQSPTFSNITLNNADKISLIDTKNNSKSLAKVLKEYKGKVILIDFWASWCIPCREQFPYLEKAKEYLKEKDIVFINISIDDDNKTEDWTKAVNQQGQITNPNHFRLLDWKNSFLTKQLELRTIPRYIIVDKLGKLQNAAYYTPSDPKFIEGLNGYLQN